MFGIMMLTTYNVNMRLANIVTSIHLDNSIMADTTQLLATLTCLTNSTLLLV